MNQEFSRKVVVDKIVQERNIKTIRRHMGREHYMFFSAETWPCESFELLDPEAISKYKCPVVFAYDTRLHNDLLIGDIQHVTV